MLSRRRFISLVPVAALGAMAANNVSAQAKVLESDNAAKALHYKEDASRIDTKLEPAFKPGSICATCALYTGKPGAVSGGCGALGGSLVAAKGWCLAYTKKA